MEYDRDVLSDEDMDALRDACKRPNSIIDRIKKRKEVAKMGVKEEFFVDSVFHLQGTSRICGYFRPSFHGSIFDEFIWRKDEKFGKIRVTGMSTAIRVHDDLRDLSFEHIWGDEIVSGAILVRAK